MNLNDTIFLRRASKRSFLDKPVEEETLARLFERIRWTPSGGNKQPWRFVFVTDQTVRGTLAAALSHGNEWAAAAPVLAVASARPSDDAVRSDDPVPYYQFSTGMAVMSLLLGATEEGLMAHAMGGYDAPKVKAALSIPEEYHLFCVIALGYQGSPEQLDERTRKKDEAIRTRKPVEAIIALNRFQFD